MHVRAVAHWFKPQLIVTCASLLACPDALPPPPRRGHRQRDFCLERLLYQGVEQQWGAATFHSQVMIVGGGASALVRSLVRLCDTVQADHGSTAVCTSAPCATCCTARLLTATLLSVAPLPCATCRSRPLIGTLLMGGVKDALDMCPQTPRTVWLTSRSGAAVDPCSEQCTQYCVTTQYCKGLRASSVITASR